MASPTTIVVSILPGEPGIKATAHRHDDGSGRLDLDLVGTAIHVHHHDLESLAEELAEAAEAVRLTAAGVLA